LACSVNRNSITGIKGSGIASIGLHKKLVIPHKHHRQWHCSAKKTLFFKSIIGSSFLTSKISNSSKKHHRQWHYSAKESQFFSKAS
jgi:hypothetical protein